MAIALKLQLVDAGLPENVAEAAIRRMEEDATIIRGLRRQNERLAEERLNVELQAATALANAKFRESQLIGRLHQLEERVDVMAQQMVPLNQMREDYDDRFGRICR